MMETSEKQKLSPFGFLVGITCFLTNLSQLPFFVERGIGRYLSFPVWIILFAVCVIRLPVIRLHRVGGLFLLAVGLYLYLGAASLITGENFFAASIPHVIPLALFVTVMGTQTGNILSEEDLNWAFNMFTISALIVCIVVFSQYIFDETLSRVFLYESKNSLSQILLTAWILVLFHNLKNDRKGLYFVFYAAALILLSWTLLGMQSRATLISIPVFIVWAILKRGMSKRLRNLLIIMVLAVTAYLILRPAVWNSLLNDVLFAGRDSGNLNDISSGRFDEWKYFFSDFKDVGLFGNTYYKRESIILSSVLQHGVVGAIFILSMAIYPLQWLIKKLSPTCEYSTVLLATAIVYTINGIFEQQAPFGPGVKCYFLWFMLGIFSTDRWMDKYGRSAREITRG